MPEPLQNPTPAAVKVLTGAEELFSSNEYLRPSLAADPLLRESFYSSLC
jgi:hypothetical protein